MNCFEALGVEPGNAICYSGFRKGQRPGAIYPSYNEIKEDLELLEQNWKYIRLYDVDEHGVVVLEVIEKEQLNLKVMLGAYIEAEMNNFGCPWGGGMYDEDQLESNRINNVNKIEKLIHLANRYSDIVFCVAVGNEACVDWTDHYVPVSHVIEYVKMVKAGAKQPVTFCENYVPWLHKLEPLTSVIDFISIHTYPVWEYKHIHESLGYTKENYYAIANKYPNIPVVITEAGWSTNSNGRGINPEMVNEENQKVYYEDLVEWTTQENILTFVFEAFDEDWKGSPEPNEPEKHWGLFKIDRTPKLVMKELFSLQD